MLSPSLPPDYNDEKERTKALAKIIDQGHPIFPKEITELIASYIILLNVNFRSGLREVFKTKLKYAVPIHAESNQLWRTVPMWTIGSVDRKDFQHWSCGLGKGAECQLEIFSSGAVYPAVYADTKEIIMHKSTVPQFRTAGSRITFLIDLPNSSVFVGVNNEDPKLVWSNIVNLCDYVPFCRFSKHRESIGFYVVK